MTDDAIEAHVALAVQARLRADRATPGPWLEGQRKLGNKHPVNDHPGCSSVALVAPGQGVFTAHAGGTRPANDGEFIAGARTDVPALASAVLALAARVRELEGPLSAGPELRWDDSENGHEMLFMGKMFMGRVCSAEESRIRAYDFDDEFIGDFGSEEGEAARAAVERAVREALGWEA